MLPHVGSCKFEARTSDVKWSNYKQMGKEGLMFPCKLVAYSALKEQNQDKKGGLLTLNPGFFPGCLFT